MKNANFTHTINTKDQEGNTLKIEISLDRYFSITCMAWEKGKPKNDRNLIYAGCAHDEIVKARPDLEIFTRLHLADMEGVPMHAAANMRYHQQNRYDYQNGKYPDPVLKFAEDYNITRDQAEILEKAIESPERYTVQIYKLGIFDQWRKLAQEGKRLFSELSGKTPPDNNPEPNGKEPDPETIKSEEEKEKTGYYAPEAIEARRIEAERKAYEKDRAKIIEHAAKKTAEIEESLKMDLLFLDILGKYRDNVIYYNHSKEIAYNWLSYQKQVPDELIKKLREALPNTPIKPHKNP